MPEASRNAFEHVSKDAGVSQNLLFQILVTLCIPKIDKLY